MFTFAVDQDWIEANPAWRVKKPGRERSRDRVLTRDELRELWPALHETEAKNADGTPKPRLWCHRFLRRRGTLQKSSSASATMMPAGPRM
jgi:hypothetical protein